MRCKCGGRHHIDWNGKTTVEWCDGPPTCQVNKRNRRRQRLGVVAALAWLAFLLMVVVAKLTLLFGGAAAVLWMLREVVTR